LTSPAGDSPITGRCLCGAVRFAARGGPLWTAHCHCESCRRHTSSLLATYAGFPSEDVEFSGDQPALIRSSPQAERGHCGRCGSPLCYRSARWPGETHLFLPSFDDPARFEVQAHVMFDERVAGFDVYDDLPRYATGSPTPIAWGPRPAARVLFLCTGNSARSIIAQTIANDLRATVNGERVRAHSAGSRPVGEVNPGAMEVLEAHGHDVRGLRSKSWDEYTGDAAPALRWVITLCDGAAGETCPAFASPAGVPIERLHWGLPDPASGAASFEAVYQALAARINELIAGGAPA
jgi:protein-tyrosine-phosphatase